MVGPSGRRRAVTHLSTLHYSERRACRLADQPRSTQRYEKRPPTARATRLRKQILRLSKKFPRYGHRRITEELRAGGWTVNRKCVRRICAEEGLKIMNKPRKRRRGGRPGEKRATAERPNHVWSYDFVFDQLESGRQLKILPVLDNYTRECLGILVAHNITARDVTEFLQQLVSRHGTPQFIRSDNGPEFIARHVKAWLADCGISTDYIEPGSPWQNSYSESFNSRFRDELLNAEIFTSLLEARVLIEEHRTFYNARRRHSSLGYKTPRQFRAKTRNERSKTAVRKEAKAKTAARAA